jgi:hypothetical protein
LALVSRTEQFIGPVQPLAMNAQAVYVIEAVGGHPIPDPLQRAIV